MIGLLRFAGCLLIIAAGALVIAALSVPRLHDSRGMLYFLAMVALLFGLPFALPTRR